MKYTLSVLVENQPGVLSKVVSLFARRGYNIDSLAVGETERHDISSMTIVSTGDQRTVDQIEKHLNKKLDVIKVRRLEETRSVLHELMLIKVSANKGSREQIMTICGICGAKVADISPTSMTMELSDTSDRVNTFEDMMRPFGILEVARTGIIALQKGAGKI